MIKQRYATSLEVAAAFLKMTMDKLVMGASSEYSVEDLSGRSHFDYSKFDGNMVRLFINLGKKDNLQVSDLVKFIASKCDIKGKEIGRVDMLDKFSFFEVPKNHLDNVMTSLIGESLKGRKVNIEVANKKGNGHRGGGRGDRRQEGRSRSNYKASKKA